MLNIILKNKKNINKYDILYILFIISISVFLFLFKIIFTDTKGNRAEVRYSGKEIMTLDLNKNQVIIMKKKDYPLLLGTLIIEVKNKKVAVIKESSPYHYCSLVGFTDDSTRPIICQPNKVTITVKNSGINSIDSDIDVEVR